VALVPAPPERETRIIRCRPDRGDGPDDLEGGMMSRIGGLGGRLYRGEVSVNFVGRQRLWYTISGCILVIAIGALIFRGLNFSVDFKGGSIFEVKAPNATISQVEKAVSDGGGGAAIVQQVGVGGGTQWHAQTAPLSYGQASKVQDALSRELGVSQGSITRPGAARSPPRRSRGSSSS
jgi:preprotein translocase subunit SecF